MKHFSLSELVAPEILAVLSDDMAWRLIPDYVQSGLDALREKVGLPIWINGNGRVDSGVRSKDSKTGAAKSGHKGYRGLTCFDLHCSDLVLLRGIVEANYQRLHICEVERYEFTPTWLHVAFSQQEPKMLKFIKP